MKNRWGPAAVAIAVLSTAGVGATDTAPKTEADKASYAIGIDIGRNFHNSDSEVRIEQMARGLRDGLEGAQPALSEAELRQRVTAYRAGFAQRQQAVLQRRMDENKAKGDAFAAGYRNKNGVSVAPNGSLYRIIKAGHGSKPRESDTVMVNYRGRLIDGTEFDASEPGHPAQFKLNVGLIQGWREALVQMPMGSRWEIVMPPPLAYGERGNGSTIPPNSTLVFEIELVAIVGQKLPAAEILK